MPLHSLLSSAELNAGDPDGLVLTYASGESRRLALIEITRQKPPGLNCGDRKRMYQKCISAVVLFDPLQL